MTLLTKSERQAQVSAVVRVLLAARNETHDDLAAALGVSRPAVSQKLQGRIAWTLYDLDLLAFHFDVSHETFLSSDVLDRLGPPGKPRSAALAVPSSEAPGTVRRGGVSQAVRGALGGR